MQQLQPKGCISLISNLFWTFLNKNTQTITSCLSNSTLIIHYILIQNRLYGGPILLQIVIAYVVHNIINQIHTHFDYILPLSLLEQLQHKLLHYFSCKLEHFSPVQLQYFGKHIAHCLQFTLLYHYLSFSLLQFITIKINRCTHYLHYL